MREILMVRLEAGDRLDEPSPENEQERAEADRMRGAPNRPFFMDREQRWQRQNIINRLRGHRRA